MHVARDDAARHATLVVCAKREEQASTAGSAARRAALRLTAPTSRRSRDRRSTQISARLRTTFSRASAPTFSLTALCLLPYALRAPNAESSKESPHVVPAHHRPCGRRDR